MAVRKIAHTLIERHDMQRVCPDGSTERMQFAWYRDRRCDGPMLYTRSLHTILGTGWSTWLVRNGRYMNGFLPVPFTAATYLAECVAEGWTEVVG